MLYFHFALNQNGKPLDFSPADLERRYSISRDRWRSAFSKLVDKGFLVPESGKSYRYTFYSMPERYKGLTLIDGSAHYPEMEQSLCLKNDSPTPEAVPVERDILSDKDRVSPPTEIGYPCREGEGIPADRESNNKNNKDILKDIKDYRPSNEANTCNCPIDEELMLGEKEEITNTILEEFGNIENSTFRILDVEKQANHGLYNVKEHIRMLKELLDAMRKKRTFERSVLLDNYRRAIDSTMPKDGLEHIKVKLILDRYIADHKDFAQRIRDNYGMWVDGWNDELQEPNMIVALYPLPESVIAKQKHSIIGIPKEYYMRKSP